jgi:hypothetical protein
MTEVHDTGVVVERRRRPFFRRFSVLAKLFLHRRLARGQLAADLRNIPRYIFRTLVAVVCLFGFLSLWESRGDGELPGMAPLFGLDPYRISSTNCTVEGTPDDVRWKGLAPALAILDQVNPTVAQWVRDKHDRGVLIFRDEPPTDGQMPALAKYDMYRNRLVVNRRMFTENDGTIAAVLCHEYRHSRQNFGKSCQYMLSFLFVKDGDPSFIENDAMIYEQLAHNNVFGTGVSKQKERAAWERWAEQQNQRVKPRQNPAESQTGAEGP